MVASLATIVIYRSSFQTDTDDAAYNGAQVTRCDQNQQRSKVTTASTSINSNSCFGKSRLIFLGTGSSTGCPRPICPLIFSKHASAPELPKLRQEYETACRTSMLAVGDPILNRNYRNNPSMVISLANNNNNNQNQTVIIDVGKTFREGALRWLPRYGIHGIDAIILTHQHMDAAAGLDDVRGFQQYRPNPEPGKRPIQVPMPLYLSQNCLECLQDQFPFLFPKFKERKGAEIITQDREKPVVARHVASFDTNVFQDFKPFEPVPGFQVTPLPVMHGEDLVSYGFAFTIEEINVVYLSDISRILPETLEYIQSTLSQPTHILVLDALLLDGTNPTHFNLQDAIALTKQIRPLQTLLVGMNCDSFLPHDEMNEQLLLDFGNIQLAHDGQVIELSKATF